MHKTSTMNTRRNLQMVLTTLLLILAVHLLDWQERTSFQSMMIVEKAAEPKAESVGAAVYTDCCLQHALQAAEGGVIYTGQIHPENMVQLFNHHPLLLPLSDSTKQIAVASYKESPQPTNTL